MGTTPASGSRILFAIKREAYPGEGRDGDWRWFKVNLPNNVAPLRPELPTGAVNPSGFAEPGLPGPVTIPADMGIPLTAGGMLEFAELFFGAAAKTTPETGVNLYTHQCDATGVLPTMAGMVCLPPTHNRRRFYNGRVGGIVLAIPSAGAIQLRMPGSMFGHTTTMGEAVEDTITGTYALEPQVRGVPGMTPKNALWAQVTDLTDDVPSWQFEACPLGGTPEFPSTQPDYQQQYDVDGRARWINCQGAVQLSGTVSVTAGQAAVTGVGTAFDVDLAVGDSVIVENEVKVISAIGSATGLTLSTNHTAGASGAVILAYNRDLGVWDQDSNNVDPLQFLPPGTTTEHGDLAVGDTWVFPLRDEWDDPTPTYDTDHRALTAAHLVVEYQVVGTSTWTPVPHLSANIAPTWPFTLDAGPGSKYPYSLDRDGLSGGALTLIRKLRDASWDTLVDEHRRVNLRLTWSSRLIGTTGIYRERVRITTHGGVTRVRPAANAQAIQETLTFALQTNAAGSAAPITLEVWTPRNYTVATTPAAA